MTPVSSTWLKRLARRSVFARVGFLTIVMTVCLAVTLAAVVVMERNGWSQIELALAFPTAFPTALVACVLCVALGAFSFGLADRFQSPELALAGMAIGMVVRMGVPLAAIVVVHLRDGPLAQAGFVFYLLVFYPVMLAVETSLTTAALVQAPSTNERASQE